MDWPSRSPGVPLRCLFTTEIFAKAIWGAQCGKSARWVLLGETSSRSHARSVRALARKRQITARLRKGLPLQGSSLPSCEFEFRQAQVWISKSNRVTLKRKRNARQRCPAFLHFLAPDRGCPAQFATGRNTATSVEFVVAELAIGISLFRCYH